MSCWLNCFDIAVQIEYWKYCVLNYKTHLPSPAPEDLLTTASKTLQSYMVLPVPFVCGECRGISCFNSAVGEMLDDDCATFYEL